MTPSRHTGPAVWQRSLLTASLLTFLAVCSYGGRQGHMATTMFAVVRCSSRPLSSAFASRRSVVDDIAVVVAFGGCERLVASVLSRSSLDETVAAFVGGPRVGLNINSAKEVEAGKAALRLQELLTVGSKATRRAWSHHTTQEQRGDREVVMKAVSQNGWMLQYATEELRGDREIVMQAVSQDAGALTFAAEELWGDREIVMKAVSQNGRLLQYAQERLRNDREIVLKAVSQLRGAPLVALTVTSLTGRGCTWIGGVGVSMRPVLLECATLMDMDAEDVCRRSILICKAAEVTSVRDLEARKVHSVKMVRSALKLMPSYIAGSGVVAGHAIARALLNQSAVHATARVFLNESKLLKTDGRPTCL